MATLKGGQWFEYPIDTGIPNRVTIREGSCHNYRVVATVTKMQALALARHHGHPGVYWAKRDGNGRWVDVRVVGDVEAWLGDSK